MSDRNKTFIFTLKISAQKHQKKKEKRKKKAQGKLRGNKKNAVHLFNTVTNHTAVATFLFLKFT